MDRIALQEIIDAMQLVNLTPELALDDVYVDSTEVNRPALQLAGYYDYFDEHRIQVIGKVEFSYLETMPEEFVMQAYERLFRHHIPCVIFTRGYEVPPEIVTLALKYQMPLLSTEMNTSKLLARLMRLLEVRLAPMIAIHGVLVDVYGEGVLILGESGLGKSEAALELVKRGHRMVADDAVELRRLSENELVGSAPEMTKNLMELRGIGVVDVKALYGVQSVKDEMAVSMVIRLKYMQREERFDRLGGSEEYVEYLGNKLPCFTVPVSPGRNVAVIVETAAVNFRQKRMGYDAMEELQRRLEKKMLENNKW